MDFLYENLALLFFFGGGGVRLGSPPPPLFPSLRGGGTRNIGVWMAAGAILILHGRLEKKLGTDTVCGSRPERRHHKKAYIAGCELTI